MSEETYESLYRTYTDDSLKRRLEYYALWTIPSVFPKNETHVPNGNAQIEHDYQSVGALMVNRLATKLASTLFPPNSSFFRIEANEELKEFLDREGIKSLVALENKACRKLLLNASYAQLVQALRLLIITGDVLIRREDDKIRVFSLKNYVVRRNNVGEDQEIILKECIAYQELPEYLRKSIEVKQPTDKVTIYTRILRVVQEVGGVPLAKWVETQEVEGKPVNYEATYSDVLCPYFTVKWNHVNGDMYGRGYVEEYTGDFAKLSELSQALTEYELNSCITLNVYNPAGQFDIDRAVQAVNGDWVTGQKEAVSTYEVGDFQKIQTLATQIAEVANRLNTAFMSTANQRQAERVTQYEIMMNANEAEQVLGGVYSQLSQSMHIPLAYLLLNEVEPSFIHAVQKGEFRLEILTGLQALSRSAENQALVVAASEINAVLPIFQNMKEFNLSKMVESIMRANGVNVDDYRYSEEELKAQQAQEDQQAQALAAQQQAMMQGGIQQQQAVEAVQQSQGII